MKKFKTRVNFSKLRIIVVIIVFLILFIIISCFKLKSSNPKLTNVLLNDFDQETHLNSLKFLTYNLDNLFNSYSFNDDIIAYYEPKTVYLYNTHSDETYANGLSIYDATEMFSNNLSKLGINTILEKKKTCDFYHTGLSLYDISRTFIKSVMEKKNIKYYIDVHRDSVTDTSVVINNKSYAKIMFVLGLDNKNYSKNKIVMEKMQEYLNKNYPGISRGIYEKKGSGVDGVYNQDLNENIILIEIGGIKNNIEEINNSTEILSLMLYSLIGD